MLTLFRDKTFYRTLLALALPIALKNILSLSVNLADSIMVSGLGKEALSGVYLANQLQTMLTMLVGGICTAVRVLATQYWGRRDVQGVKRISALGLWAALVLAAAGLSAGCFAPAAVLRLYTDDAAAIARGADYLRIVSFGFLLYAATEVLVTAMRCVEQVRIGLWLSVVTLVVNISLNYILIYGKLGFAPMGVRGAAIATVASRAAELMAMLAYTAFADRRLRFRPADLFRLDAQMARDLLKYGLPVVAGDLVCGLNLNAQSAIIGRLGTEAASAVSVSSTAFSLLSVFVYGVASATAVMIGKAVGEGDVPRVKEYTRRFQALFLVMGVLTGALIYFTRDLVVGIYGSLDASTLALTKQLLTVLAVTSVGTAYQMSCLTGIVRAGGATGFVFINDTIWVWGVVIPSALLAAFVFHAPVWVVFACLKCDQILKCSVAAVKTNRYRWIKSLARS